MICVGCGNEIGPNEHATIVGGTQTHNPTGRHLRCAGTGSFSASEIGDRFLRLSEVVARLETMVRDHTAQTENRLTDVDVRQIVRDEIAAYAAGERRAHPAVAVDASFSHGPYGRPHGKPETLTGAEAIVCPVHNPAVGNMRCKYPDGHDCDHSWAV